MIPNIVRDYLVKYILLKNEELNLIDINENNGIMDIPVIKRTTRTRRTVSKLTVGFSNTSEPPEILLKTITSPKAKKQFSLSDEAYEWIRNGWIIREYRLEKDERTVKSEQYRMGYSLFRFQQQIQEQKKLDNKQLIQAWNTKWEETRNASIVMDALRMDSLELLKEKLDEISNQGKNYVDDQLEKLDIVNPTWRLKKQVLFFHFLLALYQIASIEDHFDWKQVGARYYRKIGGSKEFDNHKKDFIEEGERLLERPLHLYGLASLGTITPILFTGQMTGKTVSYHYGSVHATTDLAVFTDQFKTDAEVLWLVENRGVLTRMEYEKEFLIESKSFVLGIDGQLRSAHRKLIEYLAPYVKQVFIWTDVDEAGLIIAKELSRTVQNHQVLLKWVVPPLEIVSNMEQFENRYSQAIHAQKEEQEQEIGGVEQWTKWINH